MKRADLGTILLIAGTAVSVTGAFVNNVYLDHIFAMKIWRFGNIIFFCWAVGLWKKYWDGGTPALLLCGLYAFYGITNEIGLDL